MIGRLVSKLGAAALACATLAAFAAPARAACVINNLAELPVSYNGVRVSADAKLNGQDVRLIVDSGAFASTLTEAVARKVGADPRGLPNVEIGGIGGYRRAETAALDLTLGATTFRHEQFVVLPGETMGGLSALLGREFLLQQDLDFDLPDGLLRFVKPVGCGYEQMVFWNKPYSEAMLEDQTTDRAEVRVRVLINGRPVLAMIDSGSPFSVVTTGAAQRVGLDPSRAQAAGIVGGIGRASMLSHIARFDTFTIGEETIKNAQLSIADLWHYNVIPETGTRLGNSAVVASQPEMLLGADFLRSHRVLFSPSHHRIYFSYMGGQVFGISHEAAGSPAPAGQPAQPAVQPLPPPTAGAGGARP